MNNEPVAWMRLTANKDTRISLEKFHNDDIPLYTHPAEPQIETKMQKLEKFNGVYQLGFDDGLKAGMQRAVEMNVVKELTDEEIKQIFLEQTGFYFDDNPADDLALMDFARAILRKAQGK